MNRQGFGRNQRRANLQGEIKILGKGLPRQAPGSYDPSHRTLLWENVLNKRVRFLSGLRSGLGRWNSSIGGQSRVRQS